MLPDEWDGRAEKVVQVVIKRKLVDTRAMYGSFKTKPGVPVCRKCQTPFNYSFRNGRGQLPQQQQQQQQHLLEADLSRPTTAASTTMAGRNLALSGARAGTDAFVDEAADTAGGGVSSSSPTFSYSAFRTRLMRRKVGPFVDSLGDVVGFVHGLVSPSRRRRNKNKLIDSGGGGGGTSDNAAAARPAAQPELWYGREFRRQLTTYFKPELDRPSLSSPLEQGGGRYTVGARVACFAGKDVWYPGAVVASRENNTFDVRYDNGDIAQHVFPHMIRFEPTRRDSRLLCCYYGLALVAAAGWPLAGFLYFSSSSSVDATTAGGSTTDVASDGVSDVTATATATTTAAAVVALPALIVGAAGVVAVVFQFWGIYAENKRTGVFVTAKFGAIFALPSLSLAAVGGLAVTKAMNPASAGSWVEVKKRGQRGERERKRESCVCFCALKSRTKYSLP